MACERTLLDPTLELEYKALAERPQAGPMMEMRSCDVRDLLHDLAFWRERSHKQDEQDRERAETPVS